MFSVLFLLLSPSLPISISSLASISCFSISSLPDSTVSLNYLPFSSSNTSSQPVYRYFERWFVCLREYITLYLELMLYNLFDGRGVYFSWIHNIVLGKQNFIHLDKHLILANTKIVGHKSRAKWPQIEFGHETSVDCISSVRMAPSHSFPPNSILRQSSTTKSPHKQSQANYTMTSYQSSFLDSKVQGAYGYDNFTDPLMPIGTPNLSNIYPTTNDYSSSSILGPESRGANTVDNAFLPRSLTSNSSLGDFNSITPGGHQRGRARQVGAIALNLFLSFPFRPSILTYLILQPKARSSKRGPTAPSGNVVGIEGVSSSQVCLFVLYQDVCQCSD